MFHGLTSGTAHPGMGIPVFSQFGGGKNYWVDLILIAVLFGIIIFLVGRASRRG